MKAHFLTTLKSEDLPGGGQWRLLEPLVFWSAKLQRYIVMRRGEVADSYSTPWWAAFLVFNIDRRPAFIHDHGYAGKEPDLTREQIDELLLEACEAVGISLWRRRLIFRGPRLAGAAHYHGPKSPQPHHPDSPLDTSGA